MYGLQFVRAVSNYPSLEDLTQLSKWCYTQRKINVNKIELLMKSKSILKVDQILIDGKRILFPDFWSQPNSPSVVLTCFYLALKKIAANFSPRIIQILACLAHIYRNNQQNGYDCLNDDNSICSVWLDSITLQGSLEKFMNSNCFIGCGFIDKVKAQCGSNFSFSTHPEFLNFKLQMPTELESNIQPIIIGHLSRFVASTTPNFILVISQFQRALIKFSKEDSSTIVPGNYYYSKNPNLISLQVVDIAIR